MQSGPPWSPDGVSQPQFGGAKYSPGPNFAGPTGFPSASGGMMMPSQQVTPSHLQVGSAVARPFGFRSSLLCCTSFNSFCEAPQTCLAAANGVFEVHKYGGWLIVVMIMTTRVVNGLQSVWLQYTVVKEVLLPTFIMCLPLFWSLLFPQPPSLQF